MTESVTIDTNILIYSIDARVLPKHLRALDIVDRLSISASVLPLQALNEFISVCIRKALLPIDVAESYVSSLARNMKIAEPTYDDLLQAVQTHRRHGLQYFDALLLSTAARHGCTALFSEDMQHGRSFGSLKVVNPFLLTSAELDQLIL